MMPRSFLLPFLVSLSFASATDIAIPPECPFPSPIASRAPTCQTHEEVKKAEDDLGSLIRVSNNKTSSSGVYNYTVQTAKRHPEVCKLRMQISPPIQFQTEDLSAAAFLMAVGLMLALNLRTHSLSFTKHRAFLLLKRAEGRKTSAHRYFGLYEPPVPTVPQFYYCALLTIASCFGAAASLIMQQYAIAALWTILLLLAMFPLFGSLRAISRMCSGHKTVHIFSFVVLIFLASAARSVDAGTPRWLSFALKAVLSISYFASGICKLKGSFCKGRRWWFTPEGLQCYIITSGFIMCRAQNKNIQALRHFIVGQPLICSVMALSAFSWELLMPLSLYSPSFGILFSGIGLSFHLGVYIVQGIDFLTYFSLAYNAFLPDLMIVIFPSEIPVSPAFSLVVGMCKGDPFARALTFLAGLYLLLHVAVAIVSTERIMPISCFSMFSRSFTMTDFSQQNMWFHQPVMGMFNYTDSIDPIHGQHSWEDLALLPYKQLCLSPMANPTAKPGMLSNLDTHHPHFRHLGLACEKLSQALAGYYRGQKHNSSLGFLDPALVEDIASAASRVEACLATVPHVAESYAPTLHCLSDGEKIRTVQQMGKSTGLGSANASRATRVDVDENGHPMAHKFY